MIAQQHHHDAGLDLGSKNHDLIIFQTRKNQNPDYQSAPLSCLIKLKSELFQSSNASICNKGKLNQSYISNQTTS
jgi:hypothetical protein